MNKKQLLFIFSILFQLQLVAQVLDTTTLFQIEKLSKQVNTSYHEGAPVVSPDGNTLYFFVVNHPRNRYGKEETQDIWYSKRDGNGNWGEAINAGSTLNRNKSNQVLAVVNDGNKLILTGGKSKKDKGLSISSKQGGEWSKPEEIEVEGLKDMNVGRYYGGTMTNDQETLILYFSETTNQRFSDLYLSKKMSDELHYSKPVKLNLSTSKDDFGPFISADNKTLYFASNRDGGFGDMDIYKCTRLDDSWLKWSKPINVGKPVNTKGFDAYFSIDESGHHGFTTRSYMSADGGSLDILGVKPRPNIYLKGIVKDKDTKKVLPESDVIIRVEGVGYIGALTNKKGVFRTRIMDEGTVTFAVNKEDYNEKLDTMIIKDVDLEKKLRKEFLLEFKRPEVHIMGYVLDKIHHTPLNGKLTFKHKNHPDVIVTAAVKNGYYTVELHDAGDYTIIVEKDKYYTYSDDFSIPHGEDFIEFEKDVYMDPKENDIILIGHITNEKNGNPLQVTLQYESITGKKGAVKTSADGYYEVILPEPGLYKLYTHKEGFLNYKGETRVSVPDDETPFTKDIEMVEIEVGATVRLNDIYFDFDKATLRPESYQELDRVVELLTENPTVEIEIAGHTDDRGDDAYNQKLSQHRADAVRKYVSHKGIDKHRIVSVGYGESKPEVANDTDENRQINRRVEFTVTKI